jgi:hypothetical protein
MLDSNFVVDTSDSNILLSPNVEIQESNNHHSKESFVIPQHLNEPETREQKTRPYRNIMKFGSMMTKQSQQRDQVIQMNHTDLKMLRTNYLHTRLSNST